MVKKGVHTVPTLRNRVVIFTLLSVILNKMMQVNSFNMKADVFGLNGLGSSVYVMTDVSYIKQTKAIIERKETVIKYFCVECDYESSTKGARKIHEEIRHDGVVYSCNECGH